MNNFLLQGLPLPKIKSNQSLQTNLTQKSSRSTSTVNPKRLQGLRTEFIKLAAKGQQINSGQGRGKSQNVLSKMEGLQIDTNERGSEIPAIITDNQVIEGKRTRTAWDNNDQQHRRRNQHQTDGQNFAGQPFDQ